MKFLIVFCCSLIATVAASAAVAGPYDQPQPAVQAPAPRPVPPPPGPPLPQRDARAPGDAERARMSPDERRQLRRDIQSAGRDIYRRDRPGPGPGPGRQQRR